MLEVAYRSKPSALAYMAAAMLPWAAKRAPLRFPQLVLRWRKARAAAAELDDVCRLAEQPRSETLPFLYFHVIGFRLHMALLAHPAFPLPIWNILQVRNRLTQHRALSPATPVDFELRLLEHRIVEKGLEFDLHMVVSESAAPAWESVNTFYVRGTFGAATGSPLPSPAAPGGPAIASWAASREGALRFSSLTGDYNPAHLADFYARRQGFKNAFLHPQRVLGACLARLPVEGEPAKLQAWIKGPIPYGARVLLRAEEDEGETRFALWSDSDARPAIVGRLGTK